MPTRSRYRVALHGSALLILATAIALLVSQPRARAASTADEMLDVGGTRLHFRLTPGCGTTILLEAGGGLDSSQWSALQQQLSDATGAAVVSYDRAGFGASDLPKGAFSLEDQVSWLHRGLLKLHVPPDTVLVSHSYGAFLTQLYVKSYARSVKAVVLIDPNTVAFIDSIGGPQNIPVEIPADMPRKQAQATARMRDSMFETLQAARQAPLPADIPVTVIAAGKSWMPSEDWNRKFDAARKGIVNGFANRTLVVAEGSGHMITQERPDIVLSTVESVVKQVRSAGPSAGRCAHKSP